MDDHPVIPKKIGPYLLLETIGSGSFSVVKLGKSINMPQVAVKVISKRRILKMAKPEHFEKEIRNSFVLRHPRIVQLIDLLQDSLNYYVVLEYCEGGSLSEMILNSGKIPEDTSRRIFKQILEGVYYIHHQHIAHRDLKCDNILINDKGDAKIADLGFSKHNQEGELASTLCGSPYYIAPEILLGTTYNAMKSDIWSCGIILYAMVTGRFPWTEKNMKLLTEQIISGEYFFPQFLSPKVKDFIKSFLNVNPEKRITIEEALKHPWLENSDDYIAFLPMIRVDSCLTQADVDRILTFDSLISYPAVPRMNSETVEISRNPPFIGSSKSSLLILRRKVVSHPSLLKPSHNVPKKMSSFMEISEIVNK